MTGGYTEYLRTRNFGSLNGLRAICIIAVVWHHTAAVPGGVLAPTRFPLLTRGFLGVDFFFMISGFLIVTLLLRERRTTANISLVDFYARRSLRIFPAYYLMLLFVAGVAFFKPGNNAPAIQHDLPYVALYVSNLVPMGSLLAITWSLATEEQFYLVIPALQKLVPLTFPRLILPLLYVFAILPPFGFFPDWQMPSFFRQTTFGPILLGVMLAQLLDNPHSWRVCSRLLGHRWSPLVALVLVAVLVRYPGEDIAGWPRLLMQWSMLLLLGTCIVRENHLLAPVFQLPVLARIGAVSYGIYLYHLLVNAPVAKLLEHAGATSPYLLFTAVALGTWLVAEISFRGFESRFIAMRVRFQPANVAIVESGAPELLASKN